MDVKFTAGLKYFVLIRQIRTKLYYFFLDFEKRHFIFAPNIKISNILHGDEKWIEKIGAKMKEDKLLIFYLKKFYNSVFLPFICICNLTYINEYVSCRVPFVHI